MKGELWDHEKQNDQEFSIHCEEISFFERNKIDEEPGIETKNRNYNNYAALYKSLSCLFIIRKDPFCVFKHAKAVWQDAQIGDIIKLIICHLVMS